MKNKWKCEYCGYICLDMHILKADNPFTDGKIDGCPNCMEIDSMERCCDLEGCYKVWNKGTKGPDGIWTNRCKEHTVT